MKKLELYALVRDMPEQIGACAMTKTCLDNKMHFQNFIVVAFPTQKQRFWTIFLSAPKAHPPQKCKFYFYCRLAVSEQTRLQVLLSLYPIGLLQCWTSWSKMCQGLAKIGCSATLGITTVQIEILPLGANFKFWACDVHPPHCSLKPQETKHEMDSRSSRRCPLFPRPKSEPAGREKPIRVAAIRVVTT